MLKYKIPQIVTLTQNQFYHVGSKDNEKLLPPYILSQKIFGW